MSNPVTRWVGACAVALAVLAAPSLRASVLFFEDFQTRIDPDAGTTSRCAGAPGLGSYLFPGGWLLSNVDNRTPDTTVAYVNDAWEVRDDFKFQSSNCAAFSTSWYSPVGQANDWMWTPAIAIPAGGATLSWRAVAYDSNVPDGYEVRVMVAPNSPTGGTGTIGNQITQSTLLSSVAAENAAWTAHTASLASYAGNTVYVGFRNPTNDRFLLAIDDVKVIDNGSDIAALPPATYLYPYTLLPTGFTASVPLTVTVQNQGAAPATGVIASAQLLRDGQPFGAPLSATPLPSLAVGASAPITVATPIVAGDGVWSVRFDVSADQPESAADLANNTVTAPVTTIGGIDWASFEAPVTGTIGIGAGNGGDIGVSFTLDHAERFDGIRLSFVEGGATRHAAARLWATDANGKPTSVIATARAVATPDVGIYTFPFTTRPVSLAPGTYVATAVEIDDTLPLALSVNRFRVGKTWVNWPSSPYGDWTNMESFGASFMRAPNVSMVTSDTIFQHDFEAPVAARPLTPRGDLVRAVRKLPPLSAVKRP